MMEVDEVDESLFVPQPLPPLPHEEDIEDRQLMPPPPPRPRTPPVPKEYIPEQERPVVGPKPTDPSNPWRHAGIMRDIGGVDGFMKVMRGTHRFPDNSS